MIRYLNLPKIPKYITKTISKNVNDYQWDKNSQPKPGYEESYIWTDSNNSIVNNWCKTNICEDMYWAFQLMRKDVDLHRDRGTEIKLSYLLDSGGDNVVTEFLDEQLNVTHSYVIEPNRWHILNVKCLHRVININSLRFSVTGRIFPN
jgi:hypothetical protein